MVKNGTRLQSQVDDTQVIVVKTADSLDDLRCGGTAMVALDAEMDDPERAVRLDVALAPREPERRLA